MKKTLVVIWNSLLFIVNYIRTKIELGIEWLINKYLLKEFRKLGTIENWELTNKLDFLHILLKEEYILFFSEVETKTNFVTQLIYLYDDKLIRCKGELGEVTKEEIIKNEDLLNSLQERVVDYMITTSGFTFNPKFISDPVEVEIEPWKVQLIKKMLTYQSKRGRKTKAVSHFSSSRQTGLPLPTFDTRHNIKEITHSLIPKRD